MRPVNAEVVEVRGNESMDVRLKCDFPARESFREELLDQLVELDAQRKQAEGEGAAKPAEPVRAQVLEDDDLWMLAAAGEEADAHGTLFAGGGQTGE